MNVDQSSIILKLQVPLMWELLNIYVFQQCVRNSAAALQ